MKHASRFLTLGLAAAAIVLIGASCGQKAAESIIEKATNSDVDIKNNSITINSNGSSWTTGESVKLPSGWPTDVYVIDGTIKSAMTITEGTSYTISIDSSKSLSEAQELYKSKLKGDGWTIIVDSSMANFATMTAEKDSRTVSVTIGTGESAGRSTVSVSVSTKS